jgi:hypothetical protein
VFCIIGDCRSKRVRRECQELCVRDFCEGWFWFAYIEHNASEARLTTLLSRSERSSPKAVRRRAAGAGLGVPGMGTGLEVKVLCGASW